MKIEELLKERIPLLDDVVYFIPKGVDTVEEYKKHLAYTEKINEVIIQEEESNSSDDYYDEEYEQAEEYFYTEDNVEDAVLDFMPIDNMFIVQEEQKVKPKEIAKTETKEEPKEIAKTETKEEQTLQLIECPEIDIDAELSSIEILDDVFKDNIDGIDLDKELDIEIDTENALSNAIGASLGCDIKDMIFGDEDESESESESGTDESGSKSSSKEEKLFGQFDIIDKTKKELSDEDDESFKDMLLKIKKLNSSSEDDLIDMIGKINIKEFEKYED